MTFILHQRDQIRQILKVLGNKFHYKNIPNICQTVWTFLKSITFKVKSVRSTFMAIFGEIGLLLILPSGHTVLQTHEHTQKEFMGPTYLQCIHSTLGMIFPIYILEMANYFHLWPVMEFPCTVGHAYTHKPRSRLLLVKL